MTSVAGQRQDARDGTWRGQVDALVQGISGGMLFGIPMLYTLEVWRVGAISRPPRLLGILLLTSIPVYLLNRTAGFRWHRDTTVCEASRDTVIAMALALLASAAVLTLLREITLVTPWSVALGKTVYAAVAFALGVSLGHHLLRSGGEEGAGSQVGAHDAGGGDALAGNTDEDVQRLDPTVADAGAAGLGALFVAANIAPTEEITLIAQAMSPPWLIMMVTFSLLVTYAIVFLAGFMDAGGRRDTPGLLQNPAVETLLSYGVALTVSMLLLFFFRNTGSATPLGTVIAEAVVLGLPAAIGGAAGRLAV